MNLIEIIVFLFTLLFMLYMTARQVFAVQKYSEVEEQDQDEELIVDEGSLKELRTKAAGYGSRNKVQPRGKIATHHDYKFTSSLSDSYVKKDLIRNNKDTAMDANYALHKAPSRVSNIMEGLPSRRQWIIVHDVIGPPKGLS